MKYSFFLLLSFFALQITAQTDNSFCASGDCKNGFGKCVYSSNPMATYEGNFMEGKWNGEGTLAVHGHYTYTGTFRNHLPHGKGTFVYTNGDKYIGAVVDGQCHGEGVLTTKDLTYTGTFRNHLPNGKGTFLYTHGNKYVGAVVDGQCHGDGVLTFKNGDVYTGEFKQGKMEGQATMVSHKGEKISGTFTDGKLNGKGTYVNKDGMQYEGNFLNTSFHGYGEAKYSDGIYKGEWKNGLRQGTGKYYTADGNLAYDGTWESDEPTTVIQERFALVKKALEKCYIGKQEATFNGEKGIIELYNCFELASDYSIRGTSEQSFVVGAKTYRRKYYITGSFNTKTNVVYYKKSSLIKEDWLPSGFNWVRLGDTYTLTLLNDTDHPGYFVLNGTNDNNNVVQFMDYRK